MELKHYAASGSSSISFVLIVPYGIETHEGTKGTPLHLRC